MNNSSIYTRRITISAVFLSIALVAKTAFSFYIPLFGESGMRVGISGIFSIMPSLLFGPLYGAVTSGLSDILGYLLKPTGAFIPIMTIIMALGGFVRGLIWFALMNKNTKKIRIMVGVFSFLLLVVGISNSVFLSKDGIDRSFYDDVKLEEISTENMHLISRMMITRTITTKNPGANLKTHLIFLTTGIICAAGLGIVLLTADWIISRTKENRERESQIPQLLIAMIVSGLLVTSLNTLVLRETAFPAWKALPFTVVWIPRVIEEIISNTVKAYFVAGLLRVFENQKSLKGLSNLDSIKKEEIKS